MQAVAFKNPVPFFDGSRKPVKKLIFGADECRTAAARADWTRRVVVLNGPGGSFDVPMENVVYLHESGIQYGAAEPARTAEKPAKPTPFVQKGA